MNRLRGLTLRWIGLAAVVHGLGIVWAASLIDVSAPPPARVLVSIRAPESPRAVRKVAPPASRTGSEADRRPAVEIPTRVRRRPSEPTDPTPVPHAPPPRTLRVPSPRPIAPHARSVVPLRPILRAKPVKSGTSRRDRSSSTVSPLPAPRLEPAAPSQGAPRPETATPPPAPSPPLAKASAPPGGTFPGPRPAGAEDTGQFRQGVRLVKRIEPDYPREARKRGEEGTVWLRLEILREGGVGRVAVERSSGFEELDRAAARSASAWRFAFDGGRPLRHVWVKIPVRFQLERP